MKLIKLVIIVLVLVQIIAKCEKIAAFDGALSAPKATYVNASYKPPVVNKNIIDKAVLSRVKMRIIAFMLPKVKQVVNIDKIAKDINKTKKRLSYDA